MKDYSLKRARKKLKTKKVPLILAAILLTLWLHSYLLALSANASDYLIRPLIGSRNTVLLESVFFNFIDNVNQIAYNFLPHSTNVFADNKHTKKPLAISKPSNEVLNLSPLTPLTNLHVFPQEGIWQPIVFDRFQNQILMAETIINPDAKRPYAYAALVKINMHKIGIGEEAGTQQPGGPIGNKGTGRIPPEVTTQNKLIAAFNGGFQYKDGKYGMTIGQKTFVPLRQNLATLVIDKSGKVAIVNYRSQDLSNTAATRQNGPLLIANGKITDYTQNGMETWGLTVTNSMFTWRSGIGVTKNGNLIYATGPSLLPQTLAKSLLAAGAVNAMQLDINPYWVRFILFHLKQNAGYNPNPLLTQMTNGGYSYLHGYQKDFFYLFLK